MSVETLTPEAFAALVRAYDCVLMPVAIGGYLYAVKHGAEDPNIYRVAVA